MENSFNVFPNNSVFAHSHKSNLIKQPESYKFSKSIKLKNTGKTVKISYRLGPPAIKTSHTNTILMIANFKIQLLEIIYVFLIERDGKNKYTKKRTKKKGKLNKHPQNDKLSSVFRLMLYVNVMLNLLVIYLNYQIRFTEYCRISD